RVYLAAASDDIERAESWRKRLREAGVEPLCSWIDNVRRVGAGNPRTAPRTDRLRWSMSDLSEVIAADVVWVLMPATGASFGAGLEAGFAYGCAKRLVFSGSTTRSVFCSLGAEFDEDGEAFWSIVRGDQGEASA